MEHQNAFERIAELEAKLATVEHERDELLVRWLSTRAELIDAKYGVEPSGLPNAEARIRELEGKLKIATENCAQAVKERDEAMHVAGVACQDLAETETELEQVTKERDLAIADRQDSDQVAEEIAMRAGRVLQELKKWREITIYPWCLDRLDGIIAMMDWTQSEEKQ